MDEYIGTPRRVSRIKNVGLVMKANVITLFADFILLVIEYQRVRAATEKDPIL